MGVLSNTRELKEDVLFRASEQLTGSRFEGKIVHYLNRVYRTLCAGASEFLPEYVEDWWWLRGRSAFNLDPVYSTGTVAVTNNSATITFNPAPAASQQDRRLLISQSEIPIIAGHTGGNATASLDKPWTGLTAATAKFQTLKTKYTLDAAVQVINSPMSGFQRSMRRINGMSPERMDNLFPIMQLQPGFPEAYALESETTVRFSHGGSDKGDFWRVEYTFRPLIVDLTDSAMSIPLVPAQWMHLLADMALTYLLIDKNDDRSNAVALSARTGLGAMLKENRRRLAKMDDNVGRIITRPDQVMNRRMWPMIAEK